MRARLLGLLAIVAVLGGLFATPRSANADPPIVVCTFSVTATGPTAPCAVSGQNTATITFVSVGGGSTMTLQGASDKVPTYVTVTGVGSSGVITNPAANTAYGGAIAPQALTYIRLNFSSVTSGTVSGTITLSGASSTSGGGVASTVNQGTAGASAWLVNCTSGCSGGAGGTVSQGSPGPTGSPWPVLVVNPTAASVIVNQGSPGPATSPWPVTTAPPYVAPTCAAAPNAPCVQITGGGLPTPIPTSSPVVAITPAPMSTGNAIVTLCAAACTPKTIYVNWLVPSTTGGCVISLYNSASPTAGTNVVWNGVVNLANPGTFAFSIPSSIGASFSTALSVSATTTYTGSTPCNTTSGAVYVGGAS